MPFDFTKLIRMSYDQDRLTHDEVVDQVYGLKCRFFEKATCTILAHAIPDFSQMKTAAEIAKCIKSVYVWLCSNDFRMFALEIADEAAVS